MRWERAIAHLDMDAFYASVEVRKNPSLVGLPVVVGGTTDRGVVAACTYEARSYGVRAAMPIGQARQLCPQAKFIAGSFDDYGEASAEIFAILSEFTPHIEPLSLDEAFLDITGAQTLFGEPPEIAKQMRDAVWDKTRLRASVGVASKKLLAKLASEAAKPQVGSRGSGPTYKLGVYVVWPTSELSFLHRHPVQALWGVGPVTFQRLQALGIRTVEDLSVASLDSLKTAVGAAHAHHLYELSHGRDSRDVISKRDQKSISQDESFATDRVSQSELHHDVVRISEGLAQRATDANLAGRTVTLKVKFSNSRSITRSFTVDGPTRVALEIRTVAIELLEDVDCTSGVRMLGLSLTNFGEPRGEQLSLLDDAGSNGNVEGDMTITPGARAAANAVAEIRERFGETMVGPASLLDSRGGVRIARGPDRWGPNRPENRETASKKSVLLDKGKQKPTN